jgi:hypothetical protein
MEVGRKSFWEAHPCPRRALRGRNLKKLTILMKARSELCNA